MQLLNFVPSRLSRLLLIAAFTTVPSVCTSWHVAHAQSADEAEAEQAAMEAQKKAETHKESRRTAPPSAIPGAESNEEDPSHARLDLNPTAALFDAINHGALNAAKEALNRGADINAHNVLDQTPLDMAIDLGRNDIMFLLLSLRTYNPDGKLFSDTDHNAITTEDGNGHIAINGKAGRSISATAPAPHLIVDGGKPLPSMGFLGFSAPATPAHEVTKPMKRHPLEYMQHQRIVPTIQIQPSTP